MNNKQLNEQELTYEMETALAGLFCAKTERNGNELILTFENGNRYKITVTKE